MINTQDCELSNNSKHNELSNNSKQIELYNIVNDVSTECDIVPVILILIESIQGQQMIQPCMALLDTESTGSWIHERMIPPGATPTLIPSQTCQTAAGAFTTRRQVRLMNLLLPNFSRTRKIDYHSALVLDSECRYDMILGRYFLLNCEIKFDFGTKTIVWLDIERRMKPAIEVGKKPTDLRDFLFNDILNEEEDESENFATYILPADYKTVDVIEVAQSCLHLKQEQRDQLQEVLVQFPVLFNGKLGHYPHHKLHIEIDLTATPAHSKPYPVPHIHHQVFKDEI
jgi:hypothetical protein